MKKLLTTLLCIAIVTAFMPLMAFAADDHSNPDIVNVRIGTNPDDLKKMETQPDSQGGIYQYYDFNAASKIDLKNAEYIYLQVVRDDAYKDDISEDMKISCQIDNQYYEMETTPIENNTVRILASQLRAQSYGEYDQILIMIGYKKVNYQKYTGSSLIWMQGEGNYYYKGKLKDIFTVPSGSYDKLNMEKYAGYYSSDNGLAVSLYKDKAGKMTVSYTHLTLPTKA